MPLDMVKDGHLGGYVRGGDLATWCPALWRWLVTTFEIQSVLDVGCGEGQATRFFRDLGCEVVGVDGCRQAIADSVVPQNMVLHDFCAGPFRSTRRFDLVWSCEFVEHLDEQFLPNILGTFALAKKVIAITHAFPGQKGHHHVNCQPTRYWVRHLERQGYACSVAGTLAARRVTLADYPSINHFARSGLVFVSAADVAGCRPSAWRCRSKAARINLSFRLSRAYRQQRRSHRRRKRQLRRAAAHAAAGAQR